MARCECTAAPQDRLVTAITTLNRMGAQFEITDEFIRAAAPPSGLRPAAVQTDTHPGFMTDWQTPLVVLFTQADGMSVLHETVYEDRLVYVPALQQMGARSSCSPPASAGRRAASTTPTRCTRRWSRACRQLKGADVAVPDVRAGFSSVIAAAIADGPSTLRNIHHLERGYHRPAEQFAALGLKLEVRG